MIVTHRYDRKRKRWVRTDRECPEIPEPEECEEGELLYAKSEDGEWIATHACIDGHWQPTGAGDSEHIPIEDELLVEHRGCSLREDPGAVYLVDGLAAEIGDAFSARLFQEPRRATVHGEIVLFDDPPLFEKHPQAWFRPLERIDGDNLLAQIAAGEPRVSIHGCHRQAGAMSQQEVISVLAERMEANKTFTERLLAELADLAQEDLKRYKKFRVPHWGMVREEDGQLRFEPYGK